MSTENPRIEITYQDVQRAGQAVLDYADETSEELDPIENFVTRIAVRLAFAARSMKPRAEHPASAIVRAYCQEVGVDYEALDETITKIAGEHRVKVLFDHNHQKNPAPPGSFSYQDGPIPPGTLTSRELAETEDD